uniref:cytochrome c oxidase subunit III n=1 Tax=Nisia atrovenosa TaxID=1187023 RepID=UPI002A81AB48|nr:cytochrome c oxidase subunit III [Nisia atrovenosa]WOW98923.1 cytochrome c oxidase subunit III [Nisia atrovenosa]
MNKNHPFHMVSLSPWPILISFSIMSMLIGMIEMIYFKSKMSFIIGMSSTMLISSQWWRDISRESTLEGNHTKKILTMMKMGMILFIVSEIMFFISFFWTFYHSSLSPCIQIGMKWPPPSILTFNPLQIPLLNTIILLSSGVSITWAHHNLLNNKMSNSIKSILITIALGVYFSVLQFIEYKESSFSISDSIYGSLFFMSTGFHGIHVIIGTLFILINLKWLKNFHLSSLNHLSFESAAWYWHFVDIVWLFLYLSIYWWGK